MAVEAQLQLRQAKNLNTKFMSSGRKH